MKTDQRIAVVHRAIEQTQALTDLFQRRRISLAASVGLTERQWEVMEEIAYEHFIPSMFARGRESSMPAVSKITRQLLDKKLIRVAIGQNDRRQRDYTLTKKGRQVMETLRAARMQVIDQVWMKMDPVDLSAFSQVAVSLIQAIESFVAKES